MIRLSIREDTDSPLSVTDDAQFWVDRRGAPVKATNAVGATTTFVRGDAVHPALVTRVTYPNGRIVDQTYNPRGNLTKIRDDITPIVGDPPTRVTEFKYDTLNPSAQFVDSPLEVWDSVLNGVPGAAARKTRYHYTRADSLTDSVYDTRGHRTSYTYKASNALKGLLTRVTRSPGSRRCMPVLTRPSARPATQLRPPMHRPAPARSFRL